MPIPVVCGHCRSKLKAPDVSAGRQLRCPKCRAVLAIPAADARSAFSAKLPDRFTVVFAGDDNQYGPVGRAELDTWLAEGRIDHTAEIWQEGSPDWRAATAFYPQLDPAGEPEPPVAQVVSPPPPADPPQKAAPAAEPPRKAAPAEPPVPAVVPGPAAVSVATVPAAPHPTAPQIPDPGPGLGPGGIASTRGMVAAAPTGSTTVVPPQSVPGPSRPAVGPAAPAAVGPVAVGPVGSLPGAVTDVPIVGPARTATVGPIGPIGPVKGGGPAPGTPAVNLKIDRSVTGRMKKGRTKVRRVTASGQTVKTTIAAGADGSVGGTGGGKSRTTAGLLGIFLGGFGAHSFYLGNKSKGILQIVVTCLTCVGGLWGFAEGVMIFLGKIDTDAAGNPLV